MDLPIKNSDFPYFSIAMLVYQRVQENHGKPWKTRESHSVVSFLYQVIISYPSWMPLSFSIFSMAQENTLDWMVKTIRNPLGYCELSSKAIQLCIIYVWPTRVGNFKDQDSTKQNGSYWRSLQPNKSSGWIGGAFSGFAVVMVQS